MINIRAQTRTKEAFPASARASAIRALGAEAPPPNDPLRVAVVDGPCEAGVIASELAARPRILGGETCASPAKSACRHGTFILGLLGASEESRIPGLCPSCELLHVTLFPDRVSPDAGIKELANAINLAVQADARLINLSLAILGEGVPWQHELQAALDLAEKRGVVIVAAAGNQGRLATGQLLSHPVTVPVVAVDAKGRLLPECNFGPAIIQRGVAAPGEAIKGYAPGGAISVMSGTSAATAMATGVLAQAWIDRPNASGADIRAAVARLRRRSGPIPPLLRRETLVEELDHARASMFELRMSAGTQNGSSYVALQGETLMDEAGQLQAPPADLSPRGASVSPAACACGGAAGGCACGEAPSWPICSNAGSGGGNFVYVLGTVDVCVPNQSIADELQRVADAIGVKQGHGEFEFEGETHKVDAKEDLRSWCYRIFTDKRGRQARYIARQLRWILRVEGLPAYYICLGDPTDLDDLVQLLCEPKPKPLPPSKKTHTRPSDETKVFHPMWPCLETGEEVEDPCLSDRDGMQLRETHDLCLFVGTSALSPMEICPGIEAPILRVDYFCPFTQEEILGWLTDCLEKRKKSWKAHHPGEKNPYEKNPLLPEPLRLFKNLVRSADNFGDTDEWRALNYLAVQYKTVYHKYIEMAAHGYRLESVKVVRSRLWGSSRRVVDPVFTFQNASGGVSKYFVRVEVTYLFPTIISHLAEYFDR